MKELKFRIWDIKNQRFDNDLVISCDGFVGEWVGGIGVNDLKDQEKYYTIQRFTGLYDKSGKEIYEGDILQDIVDYSKLNNGSIFKRYYKIGWSNGETYDFYGLEYAQIITGFVATLIKTEREEEQYRTGETAGIGNKHKFENCGTDGLVVTKLEIVGNVFENENLLK